jgi:hypothetical protein
VTNRLTSIPKKTFDELAVSDQEEVVARKLFALAQAMDIKDCVMTLEIITNFHVDHSRNPSSVKPSVTYKIKADLITEVETARSLGYVSNQQITKLVETGTPITTVSLERNP